MSFTRILIVIFVCVACTEASAADYPSRNDVVEVMSGSSPSTLPVEAETDRLSSKNRIFVRKFELTGNKTYSGKDLSALISPYENREITSEELQALQREITLYYVNRGFINSGVTIPDQKVESGIITIKVTEGVLSRIEVEGAKNFRPGFIRDRLSFAVGPPLNINRLQEALQLLQQDSRIRRINAELGPGITAGESVLKVRVEEESPYRAMLTFANNQSPSIGSYRGEVLMSHQSLLGLGDVLEGKFGLTSGSKDIGLGYSVPLNPRDTTLRAYYSNCGSTVVEETFKPLEIESRTETYGISLSHPFYKTAPRQFTLGIAGEIRRNATSLLGRPYSFTDIEDNVTHVTAMRFSQEWVSRSQSEVLAVRSVFSVGIDAFGSTISDKGADGRFFSWLGQMQWIKQLSDRGMQMVFRTDIQLANDSLLPMERFSIGGMNSVRGYRENQLVRDNGVVSSIEFRVPVIYDKQREAVVQLAAFVDSGWSWNTRKETPDPVNISSIGAGIRWAVTRKANFMIYAGHPLRKIHETDHDLQDEGIHFQLNWQVF
jgi:hemolysin activation/secretion protein